MKNNSYRAQLPLTQHCIHLCQKFCCEISALLDLSKTRVSPFIVQWICLEASTAHPNSQLRCIEITCHPLHHSLQSSKLPLEANQLINSAPGAQSNKFLWQCRNTKTSQHRLQYHKPLSGVKLAPSGLWGTEKSSSGR